MCVCARDSVNGVLCAQTSHPQVDAGEGEDVCVCVCARDNVNGVLCAQTSHPQVDAGEGEEGEEDPLHGHRHQAGAQHLRLHVPRAD